MGLALHLISGVKLIERYAGIEGIQLKSSRLLFLSGML